MASEVGTGQRQRLVAVHDVEAVRRVGRGGRDPGGPGALVDGQVLRAVPRADAEDGDLPQPRDRAADREQHGRRPRRAGGAHQAAAGQAVCREVRPGRRGPARASRMTGSLTAMCTTQGADHDPGHGEVGGPERERPGVPGRRRWPARWRAGRSRPRRAHRSTSARRRAAAARGTAAAAGSRTAWGRRSRASPAAAARRGAGGDVQALGQAVAPHRPARRASCRAAGRGG